MHSWLELCAEPATEQLFDMEIAGQRIPVCLWQGQYIAGDVLSFDYETTVSDNRGELPQPVLITCYGGEGPVWVIRAPRVADWYAAEAADRALCGHSVAFDFLMLEEQLRRCGQPDYRELLQRLAQQLDDGRICCSMIAAKLWHIRQRDKSPSLSLQELDQLLGGQYEIDKTNEYRLRFDELLPVPDEDLPGYRPWLEYAARDSYATWFLYREMRQRLEADAMQPLVGTAEFWGPQTERIQILGAVAAQRISLTGVQIDPERLEPWREKLLVAYRQQLDAVDQMCAERGYPYLVRYTTTRANWQVGDLRLNPNGLPKTSEKALGLALASLAGQLQLESPPLTKRGPSTSRDVWYEHRDLHPLIGTMLESRSTKKLLDHFLKVPAGTTRLHPRFDPCVRTGRYSCSQPNLQNVPRDTELRSLFVARPGHVLVGCDFSSVEMRTLAQSAYSILGYSTIRDLYLQGVDLHEYTAARVRGLSSVEQLHQHFGHDQQQIKQARTIAKIANFGCIGRMTAPSLVHSAKLRGQALDVELAERFVAMFPTEIFPEVGELWQRFTDPAAALAARLNCSQQAVQEGFPESWSIPVANKTVRGQRVSTTGAPYLPQRIHHVYATLRKLCRVPELAARLQDTTPDPDLARELFGMDAFTVTGRVRGGCSRNAAANYPMQALASDAMKLTLHFLHQGGWTVVLCIHDEFWLEVPADKAEPAKEAISQGMIRALQLVCPDIPAETGDVIVSPYWTKS